MPNSKPPEEQRHGFINWTINLGDVISVVIMLMVGVTAYFDVKSDVRNIKTYTDQKFSEYDALLVGQRRVDDDQNQRSLRTYTELTTQIRESKNEVKSEIRDLRNDLTSRNARR